MKWLIVLFTLMQVAGQAQSISGKVVDCATQKGLEGASVFVSNTTIGALTDAQGQFRFTVLLPAPFNLVISYIGYKTAVMAISDAKEHKIKLLLHPKAISLNELVIRNYRETWNRWGSTFMKTFIGEPFASQRCRILNHEAVALNYSKSKHVLRAYSREPLKIINMYLGYNIEYTLDDFNYNMKTETLGFRGFALFKELEGSPARKRLWNTRRRDIFTGSLLHFIRSVYTDKIEDQGFIIRPLLQRQNKPDTILPVKLQFDDIAQRVDSNSIMIDFRDYIAVTYPKKPEEPAYYISYNIPSDSCITSSLGLGTKDPLIIRSSGSYIQTTDLPNLITYNYWAWWAKTAKMLPLDYVP